ncbi:uncharacterized protein PV06_05497 [Exophiala oligosperma]|uniref:Uncharacterized protein n=1 Tax=Exophiala oligosperma TaxID=215243 RepID=A0A0D2APM6_9EURO|nr:uncharacterized protein PV06_05497 [Exophiala oligosperma]KIW41901.1 hypothetical protein PV06_05497 [Exophiala oligosperma]
MSSLHRIPDMYLVKSHVHNQICGGCLLHESSFHTGTRSISAVSSNYTPPSRVSIQAKTTIRQTIRSGLAALKLTSLAPDSQYVLSEVLAGTLQSLGYSLCSNQNSTVMALQQNQVLGRDFVQSSK